MQNFLWYCAYVAAGAPFVYAAWVGLERWRHKRRATESYNRLKRLQAMERDGVFDPYV